jgi:glycosyltransferase involved in cell wall biosynthesis
MHCLVVLPFAADKGAGGRKVDAIETLLDAHRALGIEVTGVCVEPEAMSESPVYRSFGIVDRTGAALLRSVRFGNARHVGNRLWRHRLVEAVAKFHRTRPIDVSLAVSMLHTPSAFVRNLWRRTGIPYAIQEHRSVYQRFYPDRSHVPTDTLDVLDNACTVMALTEPHAERIRKVTRAPVEVIPLALPPSFFRWHAEPSDALTWTIASWNNWRELKRLDLIISAFAQVAAAQPSARLVIAGPVPDDQLSAARTRLNEAACDDRVHFAGPLDRGAIRDLAASCDVCVVASDHETFGIPASEALAAGRPIIVTRCGGPESFVREGRNGFTVPTDDAAALADALFRFAADRSQFDPQWIVGDANEQFSVKTLSMRLSDVHIRLGLPDHHRQQELRNNG